LYSVLLAGMRAVVALAVGFWPNLIEQMASVWRRTKRVWATRSTASPSFSAVAALQGPRDSQQRCQHVETICSANRVPRSSPNAGTDRRTATAACPSPRPSRDELVSRCRPWARDASACRPSWREEVRMASRKLNHSRRKPTSSCLRPDRLIGGMKARPRGDPCDPQ
jgi:hypothetical protein